jgi:hypothetical protein
MITYTAAEAAAIARAVRDAGGNLDELAMWFSDGYSAAEVADNLRAPPREGSDRTAPAPTPAGAAADDLQALSAAWLTAGQPGPRTA